jgi:hypothetical protein
MSHSHAAPVDVISFWRYNNNFVCFHCDFFAGKTKLSFEDEPKG